MHPHHESYVPAGSTSSDVSGCEPTCSYNKVALMIFAKQQSNLPLVGNANHLAIGAFAIFILTLMWVGIFYKINVEREAEFASVQRNNLNLARVFEEHTIRTIQGLDQSVLFLKNQYEKLGDRISIPEYVKDGTIQAGLFNQLGIIDKKGIYTHSNIDGSTGVDLSDREHFRVHVAGDSGNLFISKPVLGRASNKWSLQLTRRISNKEGGFGGVVVVSLNPEYLTSFYRQIDLGSQGIVALIGADGIVRARRQGNDVSYGQDLSASPVVQGAFAVEHGTTVSVSRLDGIRRDYGYRKVKGYPLWVFVAAGEKEALAEVESRAVEYKMFAGAMSLLIIGFSLIISLSLRRQRVATEELRERKETLRAIIENEPECIKVIDAEGQLLQMNPAGLKMVEADTPEQVVGHSAIDLIAPEYRADFLDMHRRVLGGETIEMGFELVGIKGERRYVESRAAPMQVGDATLHLAVTRDVTDKRQIEIALRRSAQYARSLLEASLDPLVTIDTQGRITDVNHATELATGLTRMVLIGSDFSDYFTRPDLARAGYEKVFSEGSVTDYPLAIRNVTGAVIDVLYNASLYRNDAGDVEGVFAAARDVSERNKAERIKQQISEQLRLDQERSRAFSISASDWFWETDVNHRFCYFSENFEKVYGLPPEQLLGKSRKEILMSTALNGLEVMQAHLEKLEAHAPFRDFEYQISVANGDIRWVSVSGVPHVDMDGLFAGYRGSGTIVTERKRAEVELRVIKERLEVAAASGIVGIWDWDVPSNRLIWDSVMYQLYGVREDDWRGNYEGWVSSIHPEDKASTEAEIQAALRGERKFESEFRVIWPDGSIRHIKAASNTIFDSLGKPVRMIGVNYDLTDFMSVQTLLEEKMRLLGTILDNSSVGITFAQNRTLVWVNQRMGDIFGYTQAEMESQSTRMFYPSQESYVELGRQGYDILARGESFVTEREMRRKDGTLVWLRISGKAVSSASLALGSIWVFEDIAQQKRNQWQLEVAKEAAEAANVAKSRFLATMSHEIRTPMNGVLGMAQLLLTSNLSEAERRDYARTILSSGQTLLALLNDILDLSKIEAGKFQLDATDFSTEAVLHETCNLFAGGAQSKGLELTHQWHGSLSQRYRADSYRLRQMLSNLVGNAIKFTRRGFVRISARELERTGESALLEFSVHDSGLGVSPDDIPLLFQPFSQADSSTTREFGGTGLGLSIVRQLARAMGGEAGVESESGKGSTFWFRVLTQVVVEGQDSRETKRTSSDQMKSDMSIGQLKGHILVAEDNTINALVIKLLLGKLQITLTQVADGQQAVDVMTNSETASRPSLILMDLHMPVMDGYSATQKIRQWESSNEVSRTPIIALTADAFEEDRQHCFAVGMDDFLTKPISIDALSCALSKWLPKTPEVHSGEPVSREFKQIDSQMFAALVVELTPLLEENKLAAVTRFRELQTFVAGTELDEEVNALAELLQAMRFDLVLQGLRRIQLVGATQNVSEAP